MICRFPDSSTGDVTAPRDEGDNPDPDGVLAGATPPLAGGFGMTHQMRREDAPQA